MGASGNHVVSAAMREELSRRATSTSIEEPGKILFERGDEVRGLYLVRSGKVSLALDSGTVPLPPRITGPGAVLGLPATLSGSPYSMRARVLEKTELVFIPRAAVLECLAANQELCFEVMHLLSGEISETRAALKRGPTTHERQG
ncbi:MAG: cyclic nucleotide-binding domain-containing protein [Terriglobales bacterium]